MTTDPLTTPAQDDWLAIAAAMRLQLSKQLPNVGAMCPGDLKLFVEAARELLWMEINASTFDKEVELKLTKATDD